MQLTGIHHLIAISAKPRKNLAFYTGLLGMRLVSQVDGRLTLPFEDGEGQPAATSDREPGGA